MTMGQRLLALRTRAGLSQETLAERLGVSRQSISKWETDASIPDLDRLVRLSEIFGVTLDELVKGTADAPSGSDANNQTEIPSGAKIPRRIWPGQQINCMHPRPPQHRRIPPSSSGSTGKSSRASYSWLWPCWRRR